MKKTSNQTERDITKMEFQKQVHIAVTVHFLFVLFVADLLMQRPVFYFFFCFSNIYFTF